MLPRTLVVAGAERRPTGQVRLGGEARHVHADLGDQDLSGSPSHPVDRVQAGYLLRERGEPLLNLAAQDLDRLFQVIEVRKELAEQEGRVRPEASAQRLAQGGQLAPQPAPGEVGEDLGIGRPLDQGLQHRPARHAEDIGRHRGQLNPGILQDACGRDWPLGFAPG